jgi:hypothetical protein
MELEPYFEKAEAQTCKRAKESWDDHEVDTGKILDSKLYIPSFRCHSNSVPAGDGILDG